MLDNFCSGMKHQSVIEYKFLCQDINAVVMEFAECGSLGNYLLKLDKPVGMFSGISMVNKSRLVKKASMDNSTF